VADADDGSPKSAKPAADNNPVVTRGHRVAGQHPDAAARRSLPV